MFIKEISLPKETWQNTKSICISIKIKTNKKVENTPKVKYKRIYLERMYLLWFHKKQKKISEQNGNIDLKLLV